jgi:hypothetical protein
VYGRGGLYCSSVGAQFNGKHAAFETFFSLFGNANRGAQMPKVLGREIIAAASECQTVERWPCRPEPQERGPFATAFSEELSEVDALLTFLKASRNVFPFLDQFCLGPLVTFEFLRLELGLFGTDKIL